MEKQYIEFTLAGGGHRMVDLTAVVDYAYDPGHRLDKQSRMNYLRNKLFRHKVDHPVKKFFHRIPKDNSLWVKPKLHLWFEDGRRETISLGTIGQKDIQTLVNLIDNRWKAIRKYDVSV